ncbi:choice-of-anchor I family protein [Dapis sp. BLCC M126]|uniref:choice-of-anchor I family protein n=1 Tax=Dapis sp. BLCC M126 TaxID=3400189 RepID=UPI003CE6AE9D
MKNHQGKSKNTQTNVLGNIIKLTVQSSFAVAMMAAPSTAAGFSFTPVGTNSAGIFDDGAALHTAYDPISQKLFKVNGSELGLGLDIFNIDEELSGLEAPYKSISFLEEGLFGDFVVGGINDVAYSNGTFAVAIENDTVTDNGIVAFFDPYGELINQVTVGALPDSLTFTPDGSKLLVANEAEPEGYLEGQIDPEGSVSIIDIDVSQGIDAIRALEQNDVKFAGFQAFNDKVNELKAEGVRIFGPGATVAEDLEPESIAISEDGETAWVTLQENNAFGILDITTGEFTDIVALGFKDHSLAGNGIDGSDEDGAINIQNYPVFGMYQPDEVVAYTANNQTFLVTANEGDSRDYDGLNEEAEVGDDDVVLDPIAFPNADILRQDEVIGRLEISNVMGDTDDDNEFEELYAFGGRSFSIWNEQGELVFDSGDDFEQITAKLFPDDFNSNNDENDSFDNRSDNKGPEPEGVAIGEVDGRTLAFIGLERVGGFMTYDVSNPLAPKFISYTNNRDFEGNAEAGTAGDLGPEGLTFISAEDSPSGLALLVVANEVSGTTTIYEIDSVPEPGTIFGLLAFGAAGKLLLKRKSKTSQEQEKA